MKDVGDATDGHESLWLISRMFQAHRPACAQDQALHSHITPALSTNPQSSSPLPHSYWPRPCWSGNDFFVSVLSGRHCSLIFFCGPIRLIPSIRFDFHGRTLANSMRFGYPCVTIDRQYSQESFLISIHTLHVRRSRAQQSRRDRQP